MQPVVIFPFFQERTVDSFDENFRLHENKLHCNHYLILFIYLFIAPMQVRLVLNLKVVYIA